MDVGRNSRGGDLTLEGTPFGLRLIEREMQIEVLTLGLPKLPEESVGVRPQVSLARNGRASLV